jgi:signal transduction histidine kinase
MSQTHAVGRVRSSRTVGTAPRPRPLPDARWRPALLDIARTPTLVAAGVAVPVLAWAVVILTVRGAQFAVLAPHAQTGVEAASALAGLFGALVVVLFPSERVGHRLHWVAGGLVVLGLGDLVFGDVQPLLHNVQPLLHGAPALNTALYEVLVTRSVVAVLLVVGLLPATPPPFSWRALLLSLAALGALSALAVGGGNLLPPLVQHTSLEAAAARTDALLPGLTAWHWALSALVLGLLVAAGVGAIRSCRAGAMGVWLVVAMVLLAGAQLHSIFWPSVFGRMLTTADVLRLASAAAIAVGGILELRRLGAAHASLLAAEQDRSRHLAELAALKADFTAMVTHELASPLAAIRGFLDMLATGELGPAEQAQAFATMRTETAMLTALVADVQVAATVERDDFAVHPRPVPVSTLLAEAAAFARALPGAHPLTTTLTTDAWVWADPERIGQVLRNLLGNAAKFSPAGTPIALRAQLHEGRVRIAVADHGVGIHPDDLARIFEKFGRGRAPSCQTIAGVGLGLYLSRRIVRAHGGELSVDATAGMGAVFAFELEVAR